MSELPCTPKTCIVCHENERKHIEDVLIQRFNFFIVFFGVVIVGAANLQSHWMRAVLLSVGAVVCFMITLTLGRAQCKFDYVFAGLLKFDGHPARTSDDEANKHGPSRRRLIGRTIPWTCVIVLLAGAVASIMLGICTLEQGPGTPQKTVDPAAQEPP